MPTKTTNDQNDSYMLVKNANLFSIIRDRIAAGPNGCHVIVPHVCNNVNAFGAGFASEVAAIYPEVKLNFHMLGSQAKLGHSQFITVKTDKQYRYSITFANMIAQNKLLNNSNKRPLNYAALVYCMNQVKNQAKNIKIDSENCRVEIHCPKFGSGLAGGNWNFISELIKDIWYDIPTFVYVK